MGQEWICTGTRGLNMGLDCLIWDGTQARSHSVTTLELVEASFLNFIVVTYGLIHIQLLAAAIVIASLCQIIGHG